MGTMITVSRLNGRQFAINPDLIERIQASPDTTIIMVDGAKYIVTETLADVIDAIADYRARVIALAHTAVTAAPNPTPLRPISLPVEGADAAADEPAPDPVNIAQHPDAVPLRPRTR